jgi:hypothetical protein
VIVSAHSKFEERIANVRASDDAAHSDESEEEGELGCDIDSGVFQEALSIARQIAEAIAGVAQLQRVKKLLNSMHPVAPLNISLSPITRGTSPPVAPMADAGDQLIPRYVMSSRPPSSGKNAWNWNPILSSASSEVPTSRDGTGVPILERNGQ